MKKVKKEVKAYMICAICECGGEYEYPGHMLTTWPAQYAHICNRCGKVGTFLSVYPKIEYEEVKNNE